MKLHRPFQTMALAGLLAGAFATACSADIIYQDTFARGSGGPLNGTAPTLDNTGASATWTASAGYTCDGTQLVVNNSGGDWQGGASLPLDWNTTYPDPKVQADLKLGQAGDWLSIGFGDCNYWGDGASALMELFGNGDVVIRQSEPWKDDYYTVTFPAAGVPVGWNQLRIEYSNTLGVVSYYLNGTLLTNVTTSSHNTGVGFNANCGVAGVVTNFAVTFGNENTFPPSITTQPQGETIFVGDQLKVSLEASGTLPLQYTWCKDGAPLPDHNANTLTISPSALSDSGDYKVIIQNAYGSITSSVVRVDVHLEVQTPLAQINFDDLTNNLYEFGFSYASDPIVQAALTNTTTWAVAPGDGVGGSTGFRVSVDGGGFSLGDVSWAGFGGGVGLALPKLATANLDFFEAYCSVRVENLLPDTVTNTPGRIAVRFYIPNPVPGGEPVDVCDVEQHVTYTSNFQNFAFVLNTADYGGAAGQAKFAENLANIVRVQFEFTMDNLYTDFVQGPGCAFVVDNLKLAFRQSPAISVSMSGSQPVLHWDDPNVALQGAVDVGGPYVNISGAGSPYTVPSASPYHFFRTSFAPVP